MNRLDSTPQIESFIMSGFAFNFIFDNKQPDTIKSQEVNENVIERKAKRRKDSKCSASKFREFKLAKMFPEILNDAEIETVNCGRNTNDEPIELRCLHPALVEARIRAYVDEPEDLQPRGGFLEAADRGSDLVPRVYEGGLKVWECALDLVKHLACDLKPFGWTGKRVIELGCGAGLPGIWALCRGGALEAHFQDFNVEVIRGFTMPNVVLNEGDAEKKCRFYSGDWRELIRNSKDKFDLVLSSETIYDPKENENFLDAVLHFLAQDGVALVAAKEHYFGVGGGVDTFIELVKKNGKLETETSWTEHNGLRRAIIRLSWRN